MYHATHLGTLAEARPFLRPRLKMSIYNFIHVLYGTKYVCCANVVWIIFLNCCSIQKNFGGKMVATRCHLNQKAWQLMSTSPSLTSSSIYIKIHIPYWSFDSLIHGVRVKHMYSLSIAFVQSIFSGVRFKNGSCSIHAYNSCQFVLLASKPT